MGYNLYITRRQNYFDEEGPTITAAQWQALVESDSELHFSSNGNGPHFAIWSGPCQYLDPWFDYSPQYGCVETKNPDEKIIAKMIEMAAKLDAKVQGDDGEIYRTPTETYYEEQEPDEIQTPWWKRWLGWF